MPTPGLPMSRPSPDDLAAIEWQLGRPARGVAEVAHRCPCGSPDVVTTLPRLPDGTPFPTLYYLTCPRLAALIGSIEGSGAMREMESRLATDPQLAEQYRTAHERYVAERSHLGQVDEIDGISAGGMPERVKCLHVLAAHALAAGRGVNPLGDEVIDAVGNWWRDSPCSSALAPDVQP
jgi:hypothetical protein